MPKLNPKQLKNLRRQAGLTQKELAQTAGVSYSTLTKLEQGGISAPSIKVISDLSHALGCETGALLDTPQVSIRANKSIDFVYFDVGGVLVHWLPSLHAFAERINRPDNAVKAIFYEFDDIGCRGKMTLEELQLVMLLRLKVPFKGDLKRAVAERSWIDDMRPIKPAHVFIKALSKHHKIGLLTNVFKGYYPAFFDRGLVPTLPYKAVVKSCDVGRVKPEPEIFDIATQAAKSEPGKTLFVDDSMVNVRAARDFGWRAEHFDEYHPQESIRRIVKNHFSGKKD